MKNESFEIEQTYPAAINRVWKAITDKDEMKLWYFDIPEFKPELDFEFRFLSGPAEDRQYLHICKITEVVPEKKLAYTWRYEDYEGITLVTFELFPEGEQTRLKLTHSGLETFPKNNPDFDKESFAEGWTWIIGTSLKEFLKKS